MQVRSNGETVEVTVEQASALIEAGVCEPVEGDGLTTTRDCEIGDVFTFLNPDDHGLGAA